MKTFRKEDKEMRTRRQEIIEELTKDLSPKDKQRLIDFWHGKGSISGADYIKFADKIELFNKMTKKENEFEAFLKAYKAY